MPEEKSLPSPFKHEQADDSAGFLLWKVTALWQQQLSVVFDALGVTQTQYAILASLRWFEEHRMATTQKQLAEHARIEPMTLSKSIRKLEDNALVVREQSGEDSRAIEVRFTTQGRKLSQKAIIAVERADDAFFGKLSERQTHQFKVLMKGLIS